MVLQNGLLNLTSVRGGQEQNRSLVGGRVEENGGHSTMDSVGGKGLQRGNPLLDIFSLCVVILGLFDGVELAGSARIVTDPSDWKMVGNKGEGSEISVGRKDSDESTDRTASYHSWNMDRSRAMPTRTIPPRCANPAPNLSRGKRPHFAARDCS